MALLSNQWQGVVRRAQQRRGIIDGLIRQWQRYREMVEKLRKWLVEVSHPAEALQAGTTVPLQQARSMLDTVQVHSVDTNRLHILHQSSSCRTEAFCVEFPHCSLWHIFPVLIDLDPLDLCQDKVR